MDSGELQVFSLAEILQEPLEAESWVIEDLIATGLHLLVGPPKVGKSWLSLQMGIAVSQGEPLLGFATVKSSVLYLALEDTRNRIKARAWKLLDEANGEMYFATAAEKVSTGLIPQIESHLRAHPSTRLVIVDTLQMVRQPIARGNAYAADYNDLTPMKRLADDHKLALVMVHHTRKMGDTDVFNTVSGTTGVTGCADSTMVLSNVNRANGNATLSLAGRDREFLELKLRFRDCLWELVEVTSRDELEERNVPDAVLRTMSFMARRGERWQGTASELAAAVGVEGMSVAAFGKYLAQHSQFMTERGIFYRHRHTRTGTTLTLEIERSMDDDC